MFVIKLTATIQACKFPKAKHDITEQGTYINHVITSPIKSATGINVIISRKEADYLTHTSKSKSKA